MSLNVKAMRLGLAQMLGDVLRVYPDAQDKPEPPCAVIRTGSPFITKQTLGHGAYEARFIVTLMAPASTSVRAAQDLLDGWVSDVPGSVVAALREDDDWSGSVDTHELAEVSAYGVEEPDVGIRYLTCDLEIVAYVTRS